VTVNRFKSKGSNRYFPRQLFLNLSLTRYRHVYIDELRGTYIVLDKTESIIVDKCQVHHVQSEAVEV
jgi:hypothetical protein